jgi:hypothetical protein
MVEDPGPYDPIETLFLELQCLRIFGGWFAYMIALSIPLVMKVLLLLVRS